MQETDGQYLELDAEHQRDDGCTAVTAVLLGQRLVVAHVGDSRCGQCCCCCCDQLIGKVLLLLVKLLWMVALGTAGAGHARSLLLALLLACMLPLLVA